MHYIKSIYLILFTAILTLASCQSDDITPDTPDNSGGQTNVTLRLSAAPMTSGSTTRAAVTEKGTKGEGMNNWIILVVQNGNIVKQFSSSSNSDGTEETSAYRYTTLANGTYDFYSFANISYEQLGLTSTSTTLPADFDSKAFHVEGNQMSIEGFPGGIPMSNKQTVTVTSTTNEINLQVIRMVAKVRVQVTNTTDEPLTVQSLAIRDITRNPGKDTLNVGLFPGAITNAENGKRATNLVPTRNDSIERVEFVDTIPKDSQTIAAKGKRTFTFYVNESTASWASNLQFIGRHFVLEVRRGNTNTTRGYNANQTYVFNDWASMARNEIHVLPVSLTKYGIELQTIPYTAIGVLPSYNYENSMSTIFLGLYGHYDFVPKIRNYETGMCYYTYNTQAKQGFTVRSNSLYESSPGGEEVDDITITTLKLNTDANEIGILESSDGWYSNTDGTKRNDNDRQHLPTVGWNHSAMSPRIEFIVGNYTGWVIYTVNAEFTEKGKTEPITLSRRFRFSNTYFDLSNLAKKHR